MDMIQRLDAGAATRVLETIARGQSHGETADIKEAREVAAAWQKQAGETNKSDISATDGELARAVLVWLAEDPRQRRAIEAVVSNPPPERFDVISMGSVCAVLLLLKTKGVIQYKDGSWRFKVELVELKEGLLKVVLDYFAKLALPGK
jgi:hypothetical protein